MEYYQESNQQLTNSSMSNSLKFFHFLNSLFIFIIFSLNFLGSPAIKFVYLAYVIVVLLCTFSYSIEEIFPQLITLLFVEGQGRLVWEYQGWSRIIFDITCMIAILRIFITHRKFYDPKVVPLPLIVLISLHFIWYIVQFSNVNAASVFGVASAMKIYIFPIFLFLGITMSNLSVQSKHFRYFSLTFIILMILELSLSVYQYQEKEALVFQISSYYFKATRDGVFTGLLYRPFATTYLPGAFSIFIFLTIGIMFFKKTNWKFSLLRFFIIGFSIYNLILSQVRSALVKYALIIFIIYLGDLLFHRFSFRKVVPLVFGIFLTIFLAKSVLVNFLNTEDENIEYAVERASSLTDSSKLKSQRIDVDTFFNVVSEKISDYPIGVGPGMTGAAASINSDFLKSDPIFNARTLWTYDNLFISLIIDLGIGAFIYVAILLIIPIYFLRSLFAFYKEKMQEPYQIILVCTASLTVIILGNWGALGIPYNPESFFFWFFSGIGFLTISEYNKFLPPKNENP